MPLALCVFFSHDFGSALMLNVAFVVFQYNCISLGFTVGAVAAILSGKDLVACVLYCLALNHKQVNLLHHLIGLLVVSFITFSYYTLSILCMVNGHI